jgi:hypothetical protein
MTKFTSAILLSLVAICSYTACKKYREELIRPRLHITLKNDSAKSVAGATVRLYKNEQDPGITQVSDTGGVVFFENLEPILYYWYAEKGCTTNRVSQMYLNRPLIEDVVLYGNSRMVETGIVKISTNSNDTYKISDSLVTRNVTRDTPYIAYRKVRHYLIRTEIPGVAGSAKDTLLRINCGDTTRLVLPF